MSIHRSSRTAALGLTVGSLVASGLVLAPSAAAAPGDARITEIHYDNTGTDVGEAVEVAAPVGTDLVGMQVVLYNGSNDTAYGTRTIVAAEVSTQADGTPVAVLNYPVNGLQNDDEGIALVEAGGTLVEFLSYEGVLAPSAGPAAGVTSTNIGVSEQPAPAAGQSLQRTPGTDTWTGPIASTFGAPNAGGSTEPEEPEEPGDPVTPADTDAVVTEVHYDNTSTDEGEAIEVTASSAANLAGLSVVLYNGGSTPEQAAAAVVYGGVLAVPASATGIAVVNTPGIQNGAPDGFALVTSQGDVLEFWSYEGVLTAADGPAAGMTSTDLGVDEEPAPAPGLSLQRTPGTDVWNSPRTSSFGAANTGGGGTPPPPAPGCDAVVVPIGSAQGASDTGAAVGQTVTVRGTVVGDLQTGGLDGVSIQDAGDGNPATSDGIFVFGTSLPALDLGDTVTVTGTVTEYFGLTQLANASATDCGAGTLPEATELPLPSTDEQREALESMLVDPGDDLTVTDVFGLSQYGEVVLAQGGRLITPTEAAEPGPASTAVQISNEARSVIIDDGRSATFGATGESPPYLTADDPVRVGDGAVIGQPVVLSYGFDEWRLQPSDGTADGTTFPATNPRATAPASVLGDLRIADFNVLNYFVDFPPVANPPSAGQPRGATSQAEFDQQEAKIVAAMVAMDADIFALHEIENSAIYTPETPYLAVETLIAAVEEADGNDWDYVEAHEDTDAITNAIIFRPDRVTAVGDPMIPTSDEATAAFDNARTPIAQAFSFEDEVFSIINNHLKSKGSGCGTGSDDPTPGGQGNCNGDRVVQAQVIVDFAAEVATASGDSDVLLTGDFNAYRNEDPLDVLRAAGYQEVYDADEYSYVFDGASGSLDHVFATPSMVPKVTGHTIWDINASESFAYQYEGYEPFFRANPYRSSDHNPTLIGVTPEDPEVAATATISNPRPFRGDRVTVTGSDFTPGTKVTATLPQRGGQVVGSAVAGEDGTVSIRFTVPVLLPQGSYQVALTAADGETATTSFTLRSVVQEVIDRIRGWFGW